MNIKKVKEILLQPTIQTDKPIMSEFMAEQLARQICQLAEVDENYEAYMADRPKPDESRLIGDEVIGPILKKLEKYGYDKSPLICIQHGARAQLAQDQAHEQETMERIFRKLETEGIIPDNHCTAWQALKKQEGIK